MAEKKVKGLILRPGKYLEEIEIEDSLQGMYNAIGCDIIQVAVIGTDKEGNRWQMILDEEGKINRRQVPNAPLDSFGLVGDTGWGPMLFLGLTPDSENCDLTDASKDEIHERLLWRSPRKFDNDPFLEEDYDNKSRTITVERFGRE